MNQPMHLAPPGPDVPFIQGGQERPFDWMPDLLLFVRRRWPSVVLALLVCLALAAGYMLYATPKYTATAALLVDTKSAAFLRNQPTVNDAQYINGLVESQAEVVQSDGVARAVVRKLHLTDDEAFLANGHGRLAALIGAVRGLFAPATNTGADQRETLAAALLQKLLSVTRLGESYVLNVSVTTRDPRMSARLANAVAAAYAQVGLDVKNQATRRAGGWMDDRLAKLRVQASDADAKVQAYKAAHNIIDTDKGLLDQHELSELSGQLVLAHAATAQAKARYDQIQLIMKNGVYQGSVMDSLSSDVISKLREQYLSDQRRHTQWAAEFGANNGTVRKLEKEMAALRGSIESELARIADGYHSAYRAAAAGEQAIQDKLHQLTQRANGINEQLVTMRSLQNQADTYRSLYANFLQRYTQALQDESFPVAEAEVIAQAQPPAKQSWPNPRLILAAAAVLGLGAGFGVAILRDSFDRGIRTAAQLRAALGVDCLGLMPLIADAGRARRRRRRDAARNSAARSLANWPPLLRLAGTAPMSQAAEVMRRSRARIDQLPINSPGGRVIGCVSACSGEGKSTISANLAASMARSGKRTLLIDWDLRKLSLTTALETGPLPGFIDIVTRPSDAITDVLWQDPVTQLQFLPAGPGAPGGLPCPVDLLHTPATQALIDAVRRHYDYVVVDLPAMEAASDADSAAAMVDAVLLVVEWGRTDVDLIADCLAGTHAVLPRLMGAVLNKVELRNMRQYGDYGRARGASYAPARIGPAV